MADNLQQARLIAITRLLGELCAYQAYLAEQLRSIRLVQSVNGAPCRIDGSTGPNGHAPDAAAARRGIAVGGRTHELALPHATKRDYDYFTELEQRLSELGFGEPELAPASANGNSSNGHGRIDPVSR